MTRIGGVGYHVAAVPVTTFQTWLKLSKVLEFTYTPAVMFAKLAALFLYHQVFEVTSYRRVIIGLGVITILQGVIAQILAFSICRPFRYFWTQAVDVNDGTCGDVMLFYKSYSIPSLVTDVAMLIIPWPILLKLQMPISEKIGLMLTFMTASLYVCLHVSPTDNDGEREKLLIAAQGYNNMRAPLRRLLHRPALLGPDMVRLGRPYDLRPRRALHLHDRQHPAHHAAPRPAGPQASCARQKRRRSFERRQR
jgi:hypothetical protein